MLLWLGICTRLIVGFAPSVYVSGIRTELIFIFTMLINIIILLDDDPNIKKYENLILVFAILSYLNNVCLSINVG